MYPGNSDALLVLDNLDGFVWQCFLLAVNFGDRDASRRTPLLNNSCNDSLILAYALLDAGKCEEELDVSVSGPL